MANLFSNFDAALAVSTAKKHAENSNETWDESIQAVFSNCCASPNDLFPKNIRAKSLDEYIQKWVKKYYDGYHNRPSKRVSGAIGTKPDKIVDTMVAARLSKLSSDLISMVRDAHRLSMSAENLLGLLLEEFIADTLQAKGWHCCWGKTIKSVDFCTDKGLLLQVKNRSNTENSSSSKVRVGTNIIKWYRVNANNGTFKWDALNELTDSSEFSEESFILFVKKTIGTNNACLFVENEHEWEKRAKLTTGE